MCTCFVIASFTANHSGQWPQAAVTKFVGKVKFENRQWRDVGKAGQLLVTRLVIKTSPKSQEHKSEKPQCVKGLRTLQLTV